ncbi:DTW domain-containing protein, partial [Bacillus anthracis]|nr:DTW domain-containing protein [Bacillus anthracis]
PQPASSRFCLIMFDTEPLKPSNTGRLIADILPNTQAFLWARTEVDPELLAAIRDSSRQPYVVFPEKYADPDRQVLNQLPISDKPPLFILLDGT